ncbi:MAG TPA: selenium cofactor biosynthesis protein YqeC [Candidatus Binatus sp.]|nr:selenium cofactor biosynthesis protein YqeC [Candidatus Binatus sp.]
MAALFTCNNVVEELGQLSMQLKEALGLRQGELVSFIGAGGKTTTMFRLAHELREENSKVLVTTTTKIFKPSKPHVDRLFLVEDIESLDQACAEISPPVVIGAGTGVDSEGKLLGLPPAWLDRLNQPRTFHAILVEADGAASRLFKVPNETEPVIPVSCELTIWLIAIGVLNRPLDAESIHRPDRALALLHCTEKTIMTEDLIVQLVDHPAGCWKGIPPTSRKVAVINQADTPEDIERAMALGRKLLDHGAERVAITSYSSDAPVKELLRH